MITNFKIFEQYIKEAITTDVENLLNSINDKKVDFYSIGLSNDDYVKERIEDLYDDADFNKQLFKKNLKKGEIESTLEIENFLRKDTTYIYQTSNSGNNWILKDKDKKTVEFKENLENDEIKELIKSGAKLKIID
jgi:phosphopentomutase